MPGKKHRRADGKENAPPEHSAAPTPLSTAPTAAPNQPFYAPSNQPSCTSLRTHTPDIYWTNGYTFAGTHPTALDVIPTRPPPNLTPPTIPAPQTDSPPQPTPTVPTAPSEVPVWDVLYRPNLKVGPKIGIEQELRLHFEVLL